MLPDLCRALQGSSLCTGRILEMGRKDLPSQIKYTLLAMACAAVVLPAVTVGATPVASPYQPGTITDTEKQLLDSQILFDTDGTYTIRNANNNTLHVTAPSTGLLRLDTGDNVTINGNVKVDQQGYSQTYWSGYNQIETGSKLVVNGDFYWNNSWDGSGWWNLRENFNIKGEADFNGALTIINDVGTIGATSSQTSLNVWDGQVNVNGDAFIYNRVRDSVNSGAGINAVAASGSNGVVNFRGDKTRIEAVNNDPNAVYAWNHGTINIHSNTTQIIGTMNTDNGTINAVVSGPNSYWYGDEKNVDGNLNLTLKDGAEWGYFGDSTVNPSWTAGTATYGGIHYAFGKGISSLTLENGGIVNMYDEYLKSKWTAEGLDTVYPLIMNTKHDYVYINDLKGQNGIFQLDLNSSDKSQSDMIYIKDSTEGAGNHSLQSYANDNFANVSAENTLRFATVGAAAADKITFNDSQNIYGKSLWDYKILIGSEAYDVNDPDNAVYNNKASASDVVGGVLGAGAKNWFIYGYEKAPTVNAQSLIAGNDALYATWTNGNSTLRNRLGELNYQKENHGLWTRIYGGKLKGDNFSNSYKTYQIGYDAAFADKDGRQNGVWYGGAAFEYTDGNTSYTAGSGDMDMSAVSLYATKKGKYGDNVDIVLKHGQLKGDIDTYGRITDSGDFDTKGTSLSVEYNKRMTRGNGVFVEPQAQLTLGHINGTDYTTDNGTKVNYDGMDSAIARLGLAVGKDFDKGNVYFKVSALHEFGGKGGVEMLAADGSGLSQSKDYSSTWCELGVGTNIQLSKNSHLYVDVERSFGGEFEKQWQANAGVNWTF